MVGASYVRPNENVIASAPPLHYRVEFTMDAGEAVVVRLYHDVHAGVTHEGRPVTRDDLRKRCPWWLAQDEFRFVLDGCPWKWAIVRTLVVQEPEVEGGEIVEVYLRLPGRMVT